MKSNCFNINSGRNLSKCGIAHFVGIENRMKQNTQ